MNQPAYNRGTGRYEFFSRPAPGNIPKLIVSMAGMAKPTFKFRHGFPDRTGPFIYPFYLLHLAIIAAVGYFIVRWDLPVLLKLMVLAFVYFASFVLLYRCFQKCQCRQGSPYVQEKRN